MNINIPYKQAFVRTPYYSLNKFLELPIEESNLITFVEHLWIDNVFKESIFIASPELYYEWEKSNLDSNYGIDKKKNICLSILKYYVRATTRSTPFGLFSCYSTLNIDSDNENPSTEYSSEFERYSSIDMFFLYNLIRDLNANPTVRMILHFSVNNSLYRIGNDYRYVEVLLNANKRNHILTSLEHDEVLELIFSYCSDRKTIDELSQHLVDNVEGVTFNQALAYIHDLISSQILTSDLDISLNGETPLKQLLNFFNKNLRSLCKDKYLNTVFLVLEEIQHIYQEIDQKVLGNQVEKYHEIFKLIEKLNIAYEKKYLVNANLKRNTSPVTITSEDIKKIDEAIEVVSLFSGTKGSKQTVSSSNLEKFKEKFYTRYEDKEVPLVMALDNEIGIGYLQSGNDSSFSGLIDDIHWSLKNVRNYEIDYNEMVHGFWSRIFLKANNEGLMEIDLIDYDLSKFTSQLSDLSRTFMVMISKASNKLVFDYATSGSSLETITRFSNSDKEIQKLVRNVVKYEEIDENIAYSELLHIPDDRHGNVLLRSINRQYETPFLTIESKEDTINIQDITVSIKNNKLVLKSLKLNKEVKIFNTTAHNFYYNSLPIYQFLCDLQHQDTLSGLSLNFGDINKKVFKFLPRVIYNKFIVLSPASWNIFYEDFEEFIKMANDDILQSKNFKKFLISYKLPRYFFLVEGDNQLLIDVDNQILMKILYEDFTKKKTVLIKEFLYEVSTDNYCNEVVIPYINNSFKSNAKKFSEKNKEKKEIKRKYVPGDEWLYYKIYTGVKTADKILIEGMYPLINFLKKHKLIESWFFVRYNDSDFHIRIRFKIDKGTKNSTQKIMDLFNERMSFYIDNFMIWKLELSTYERELERYEQEFIDFSEFFFYQDSELLLQLMVLNKETNDENLLWILSCKCIDEYLKFFEFTLDEKHHLLVNLSTAFQDEFEADKMLKKQIDSKFRLNAKAIAEMLELNPEKYKAYFDIINETIYKLKMEFEIPMTDFLNKERAKRLVESLLHMHINRISKSNPRAHELVLYGFFEKYYRQQLGKRNYQSQTELA